ncbi:MAG TPA: methionyl-tRNA formyltransferase [Dehalococcoidia bacterium]|nr:methionyl-tRNA formyltransferase [Dehalococcoidia bacterium]
MRIFLNGIGAFGLDVFTRLREAGEEIVAVAAPAKSLSGRADRLSAAAEAAGVPVYETAKLGEPEVEAALRSHGAELGVMAFVNDFINRSVLDLPTNGTIQYHPSLLPKHRGRSSINWAIIQGEARTGATIFWPDEGVDTGPVLLQREVEIGPDDTAGSLYYDKLYPLGIDLLAEAVTLVKEGRAPKLVQDEAEMTYERPCQGRAARIDWRLPVGEVYNLIRGCEPSPGAWTRLGEQTIKITGARPLDDVPGEPGVVSVIDEKGIIVGAKYGSIFVRQLQLESGAAAPAHEVAPQAGLKVGDRFLNPRVD